MKTICKSCGMAYPVNPEYVGCLVECPHCGETHTLEAGEIIRTAPRSRPPVEPERGGIDGLGFILGLLFNVIGLMIATGVGGRKGCISALWGMLVGTAVCVIGVIFLAALSAA